VARLEIRSSGKARTLDISAPHLTIGRQTDNIVALPQDESASRHHAVLEFRDGHWWIRDLRSRNGTTVDGHPIEGAFPLIEGSRIGVGDTELILLDVADDPGETIAKQNPTAGRTPLLSTREREVVALVAAGLTDDQIGQRLFISVSTVRSHLDRIRDKTGHRRRPDLTRLAHELGLPVPATE
jgi:DNA-binding CsgD family transcriptional regulator